MNLVSFTVGMVSVWCPASSEKERICVVSSLTGFATGFDNVVAINGGESVDEGTESDVLDATTVFLSENCGGNGLVSTSCRGGTAFNIGESENEDAFADCC